MFRQPSAIQYFPAQETNAGAWWGFLWTILLRTVFRAFFFLWHQKQLDLHSLFPEQEVAETFCVTLSILLGTSEQLFHLSCHGSSSWEKIDQFWSEGEHVPTRVSKSHGRKGWHRQNQIPNLTPHLQNRWGWTSDGVNQNQGPMCKKCESKCETTFARITRSGFAGLKFLHQPALSTQLISFIYCHFCVSYLCALITVYKSLVLFTLNSANTSLICPFLVSLCHSLHPRKPFDLEEKQPTDKKSAQNKEPALWVLNEKSVQFNPTLFE